LNRIQKQIQSDLSPKFTEMKTGVRTSRFGRPQREAQQDLNSIPTDVAKFVSKHSPKRLKPKENNLEESQGEELKVAMAQEVLLEDKENLEGVGGGETMGIEPETMAVEAETMTIEEEKIEEETMEIKQEIEAEIKQEQEDEEQFTVIVDEPLAIDDKVPETFEANVEVFKDVPRTVPSECSSSKQDFSDTDSALGNDIKNNNGEFVAGQVLWGSFSRSSWFPCMAYPITDDDSNVISGKNSRCLPIQRHLHDSPSFQSRERTSKSTSSTSDGTDSSPFSR
jgi:hypothetical protein